MNIPLHRACCYRCNCHLDSLATSAQRNIPVALLTPPHPHPRASQRSTAKVPAGKENFREIRKPPGELEFLFISTTPLSTDKQERSSAVEELRHQRSRGRSLADVTGIEANPLLEAVAFFSQEIGPQCCRGSQQVVLLWNVHLHEGKAGWGFNEAPGSADPRRSTRLLQERAQR